MDILREEREKKPAETTLRIRAKASMAITNSPTALLTDQALWVRWIRERACLEGHKVLAFLMQSVGMSLDMLSRGDVRGAEATLSLTMATMDQVTM